MSSCAAVCKVFRKVVLNNNFIWDAVAQRMGCQFDQQSIPTSRENGAMRLKIKAFVSLKNSIKNFDKNEIPEDIRKIVNDKNAPSESQINLLKNYCKARDTIVVWQKMAEEITQFEVMLTEWRLIQNMGENVHHSHVYRPHAHVHRSLNLYKSADKVIAEASEFEDWFNRNNSRLARMEKLNFRSCQLTCLPKKIGNLSSLKRLDLRSNQLTCLPKEIGNLSSLKRLFLWGNPLTCLTEEIKNLKIRIRLPVIHP